MYSTADVLVALVFKLRLDAGVGIFVGPPVNESEKLWFKDI